jgi:hypothetical protein
MRLWSLHPSCLDAKGLVALWREALLAKHVLLGKTKGYKNHPQLNRFKDAQKPVDSINQYLAAVYEVSLERGYNFDKNKIDWTFAISKVKVTRGQIDYERKHLLAKLWRRDRKQHKIMNGLAKQRIHPLFRVRPGGVESWEIVN